MSKQTFHQNRVVRLLDEVATRVILKRGTAKAASVTEIVDAMTPSECAMLVRSAYVLAAKEEKP